MLWDYGTIYNVVAGDPINSHAYMSWLGSGTTAINYGAFDGNPFHFFVQDNSNNQEASYLAQSLINGRHYLYVNVVSGTSAIYQKDQIDMHPVLSFQVVGIKRLSSTSYATYYLTTSNSTSDTITLEFRAIVGVSGSSNTDILVDSKDISIVDGSTWTSSFTRIGRSTYIIIGSVPSTNTKTYTMYCGNMDFETLEEVTSKSFTVSSSSTTHTFWGSGVIETLGTPKLWIGYWETIEYSSFPLLRSFSDKVYFDGGETEIFFVDPYDNSLYFNHAHDTLKYNYQTTKVSRTFTYDSTDYYLVIDSVLGVSISTSTTHYPDNLLPISFVSPSVFPMIGKSGTHYYWLDADGKTISEIILGGVTSITTIFPTLDTVNGDFYASGHMVDGTDRLLSVNPSTQTITYIFSLPAFPFTATPVAYANHGNFFITRKNTVPLRTTISYIVDVPPILKSNDVQSILEMN